MKSINEYLTIKINKDKIYTFNINEYCIAVIIGDIPKEYKEIFDDAKFVNSANPDSDFSYYWLLTIDIAKEYDEKYGGIIVYQIPNFCHTKEDIKSAGQRGALDVDDLKMIDIDNL